MGFATNIDARWVYDLRRTDASNLTDKEVKLALAKAQSAQFVAHALIDIKNKKRHRFLVSSKKEGFGLAMAITDHLKAKVDGFKELNFCFIEQQDGECFVVVVQDGCVIFDNVVEKDSFEALFVANLVNEYLGNETDGSVVVAGEVLSSGNDEVPTIIKLEDATVKHERFKTTEAFLNQLIPDENHLELLPGNKVLIKRATDLKPILVLVFFLILAGFFLLGGEDYSEEKAKKVEVDPYKKYTQTLTETGINVKARLAYLFNDDIAMENLVGWKPKNVTLKASSTIITLENEAGSFAELEKFSVQYNYQITKVKDNYVAVGNMLHAPILQTAVLVPTDSTIRFIEEAGERWLEGFAVDQVLNPISNSKWEEVRFQIKITEPWTRNDFDTLGTIINGLPVGFETANLTVDKDQKGYTGTISLIVFGD